jgi:hypothetical protein
MYATRLGTERASALNRFADLAAAGVPLAFGSDAPVTRLGAWAAVRAAVQPHDRPAGIPAELAFAAHTDGGWHAARRRPPALSPGAPASFAIWQADGLDAGGLPDLAPGRALPSCLATVRAGTVIHDAGELSG